MAEHDTGSVPRLALRGIRKEYPGTLANDDIDLNVLAGEIHALLGENGAGKSTLVKIIYGVVKPDAGVLTWQGTAQQVRNPAHARSLGIGMVFQHFNLFETLTVAENIALGIDNPGDMKALSQRIVEVSERYGLPIDPRRHVHSLSIGERQRVEIVRCLLQDPKLLIMDEPTSVLTPQEVDKLFETLRRLAGEGVSILYISHKLDEIRVLCDGATVLRQGRVTAHCTPAEETPKSLAEMMIGSELPVCERTSASNAGSAFLAFDRLSLPSDDPFGTDLGDVSLTVNQGEIVGIVGVTGNGQKELLAALSGERLGAPAGSIRMAGRPIDRLGPAARRGLGLSFVPEERLGRGAVPEMALTDNALLTGYDAGMVRRGFLRFGRIRDFADRVREAYDVRCAGIDAEAKSLSGGNLQKFIIGREIMLAPRLLVAAYPTWGVDVGAATTIRQAFLNLAAAGTAVLIVSEDLDELFEICDRVAVIAEGRLSPARPTHETTVEELGRWMSGMFDSATGQGAENAV